MSGSLVEEGPLGARLGAGGGRPEPGVVVCVDVGSTYTKAVLVDLGTARIVASASRPTTVATDVMEGYDAARADLVAQDRRAATAEVLACSSAGGGLRILVVGNEALVTAEAGRRVALSSGGRVVGVVAVASWSPDGPEGDLGGLLRETTRETRPDVVLLTGGTDGGNAEPLLAAARGLRDAGWTGPTVVAGDVETRDEAAGLLPGPSVLADNVLPRIGVLAPGSARSAVREVFLSHVIGGKGLSRRPDFAAMVRGATPDVVLTGVELLARGHGRPGVGDVVVVDVGGATTDVHSVVEPDPEDAQVVGGLGREVVATTPVTRTVEGDLGMRWSAPTTVVDRPELAEAAARRQADPGWLPQTAADEEDDLAIAAAAVTLSVRRHAGRARVVVGPGGPAVHRSGVDLRRVGLVVGSGGVLRAASPGRAEALVRTALTDADGGGWQLPTEPRVVVDRTSVLAAAGLLAGTHPEVADALCRTLGSGREAPVGTVGADE